MVSSTYLWGLLVSLIAVSGVFSGSETGMMALNRYRLQHRARKGHAASLRVQALLKRPDRLLGVILIGNTFANILASAVMTMLSVRLFGSFGVWVSTILLTVVVLIFAEVMPKTLAACYPERVAYAVVRLLALLLKLLYPLVWLINGVSNAGLRLFGIEGHRQKQEILARDELRGLIRSGDSELSRRDQDMLTGVLDLERMRVDDVMVPRGQIEVLDLSRPWPKVLQALKSLAHEQTLVVQGQLSQPLGMLMRQAIIVALMEGQLTKANLINQLLPVHYIPEGLPVNRQLEQFKKEGYYMGLVVDEYGDILGLLSIEDIIDEIIGEMYHSSTLMHAEVVEEAPGCFRVPGRAIVRELNRQYGWQLPDQGPNTLNGLVTEHLETIPDSPVCLRLGNVALEVVQWRGRKIDWVKIWSLNNDAS